jgi:S1-C subfamily serine protease
MKNISILSVSIIVGLLAIFVMGISREDEKVDFHSVSGIVEYMSKELPLKQVSHGSGVFISDRHVLTAAHVLLYGKENDKVKGRVRLADGDIYHFDKIVKSEEVDVALITLDRPYRDVKSFPKFSCGKTTPGDMYRVVGSPLSIEFVDLAIRATGGRPMMNYHLVQQNEFRNGKPVFPDGWKSQGKIEVKPKYEVIPPSKLPKGDPQATPLVKPEKSNEQKVNLTGTTFFQGPALPGQSGSPVYDKNGDIRGVVVITLYDDDRTSYTNMGLYVDSPATCKFVKEASLSFDGEPVL